MNNGVKAIYSGKSPSLIRGLFGKALCCRDNGSQDVFRYRLNLKKHDFTITFSIHVIVYSRIDFGNGNQGKG